MEKKEKVGVQKCHSDESSRCKILIVTGGFFPSKKFGGPPVSVDNFCSLLHDEADCYIVTHNHDFGEKKQLAGITEGWNDRGTAKVLYLSDKEYGYAAFYSVVESIKPDYIYLQSLFSVYVLPCLRIAEKKGIKTVLAPRGELCAGAFKKKYKKIPYILLLRIQRLLNDVTFQSTSVEETAAIKKYLGVSTENIHYLTNIPSIPSSLPERVEKKSGVGRFVFISRIHWKKNLLLAIKCLNGVKGEVTFDIYGPKEDEEYWNKCENSISELPDNIHVNYCGVLGQDEIHKTFNKYDAFLFPTLSENYGHVIAEALVTECIPIISDQTPWTDMNESGAGWALPLTDEGAFIKAIQNVVDMNEEAIQLMRNTIERYTSHKLNINKLKAEYLDVFK